MAELSHSNRDTVASESATVEARFRQAWATGKRPSIAEFLRDAEHSQFASLLLSLFEIDWRERVLRGESPRLEEYLAAFPEFACLLEEVLIRRGESIDRSFSSTVSFAPRERDAVRDELSSGDRLGRYVLERQLGQGGFGVVWRAHDPELGRSVAIKVLRADRRDDSSLQDSLLNEARKIAQLNHDSILKVHDILREGANVCIVTELLSGGSLAECVDTFAGRPWEAAELVRRTAEALHHAHLKGVVHRDVKPRNILLGANGAPRLADFGLAVTEFEQLAEVRCALGTMAYMPPEAARGDSHYAEPRSDIYSLGVVFYQLLTQRLPFVAQTADQWLRQAIERAPRPLRTIDDRVPPELERIVLKCLAKDVADRYTTAADLADEIANAARSKATAAPPITAGRARLPQLLTAIVVGTLVGSVSLYLLRDWNFRNANKEPEPLPLVAAPRTEAVAAAVLPELDLFLSPPNEWVSVLRQSPPTLLQSQRREHVVLKHDAKEAALQVMDPGWSLLEIGHTEAPQLEMQAVVSQPGWEGGLGFFFGFHDSPEFGPGVKRFQTVKLERASDRGDRQLQWYLSFMEVDEIVGVRRKHGAPLGEPFSVPARPLRLEFRIVAHNISVRCGPEAAWATSAQPLRWVEAADFSGKFGLFIHEASGTFSNFRVKIPKPEAHP